MKVTRKVRGSVLAMVAVMLLIIGMLAMVLMDRTLSSSQRATWSRDHVALRLLAESAAEDMMAQLAKAANDPATEAFRQLRTIIPQGEGAPVFPMTVTGVTPAHAEAEMRAFEKVSGLAFGGCTYEARIVDGEEVSDDAIECRGVLQVVVQPKFSRRGVTIQERVTLEREFRVARHTLSHPLQMDALLLKRKPRKPAVGANGEGGAVAEGGMGGEGGEAGPGGTGGEGGEGGPGASGAGGAGEGGEPPAHSYYSAHVAGSRKMPEVVGGEDGDGMHPSPPDWVSEIAVGISLLHPRSVRSRAQFVGRRPWRLMRFIDERLEKGLPVMGLYFSGGRDELLLTFPSFSGNAVIVARGPVVVGDIKLADAARDSLTIVSGRRIRVVGANVEANLVAFGGRRKRVQFATRTKVTGTVISTRQPRSRGLSNEDYEASEIAGVPGANYEGNLDAAPPAGAMDMEELKKYTTVLAPEVARISHKID